MTYALNIDQEFAIANNLSLVQVSTLAAFMTLPIWTKTIAIDGYVWYKYSDEKMAEDFPLLFGVAKRCYKNIVELATQGFVELTKLGREKYVRFTDRCADWNKEKVQKRTFSPKTDKKESENGLSHNISSVNNIYINSNIKDKAAEGGLFPDTPEINAPKTRGTTEPVACIFANSRYADYDKFAAQFDKPEFADIDIYYYFQTVKDWSAQKGKKMKDWIATARNFMRSDMEKKKLHKLNNGGLSADAIEYLQSMAD